MQLESPALVTTSYLGVIKKDIQADRQTDTDKQMGAQAGRHTHRQTHTHQISLPHETDKAFDFNEEE